MLNALQAYEHGTDVTLVRTRTTPVISEANTQMQKQKTLHTLPVIFPEGSLRELRDGGRRTEGTTKKGIDIARAGGAILLGKSPA